MLLVSARRIYESIDIIPRFQQQLFEIDSGKTVNSGDEDFFHRSGDELSVICNR
jgi:hypothetical protein